MVGLGVLAFCAGLAGACADKLFTCRLDADCSGGECAQGYCAFPDAACPGGLRWGEHSGPFSGQCVTPDSAGTAGTGADTTEPAGAESSDGATTSVGVVDSSGSSDADVSSTGDTAGPGAVVFRDDELDGEFGEGSGDNVEYADGRLQMTGTRGAGRFVSRVFDAGQAVAWDRLSWAPLAPYGKALPDDAGVELGYAEDGIDMAGNVLLMHFDGPGDLPGDAEVSDTSGRNNHGTIITVGSSSGTVEGVFGGALFDHVDGYVSIPTAGTQDFDFGNDDFTWSIWFQFTHGCETNNTFIGVDDLIGGGDGTPHLWMGCTNNAWDECPVVGPEPRPAGVLHAVQGDLDDGAFYCGGTTINDGQWHHMAIVKEGHVGGEVRLYVDGELDTTEAATFAAPILMLNDSDYGIGGFSGSTFPSQATLDDAAMWTRALGDGEVAALYRRGARGLTLQVRACTEAACADEPPFVGGDTLSSTEFFVDPDGALAPETEISVAGLPATRYLQYRVEFTGPATSPGPALTSVTITGAP